MSSGKIAHLFYSYLKHPYYEVVRDFKNHKKIIEKEASNIMKELIDARNRNFGNKQEAADYFRKLRDKLRELKEVLKEFSCQEDKLLELLGKRAEKMAEFEAIDPRSDSVESTRQLDSFLQSLVQDYFNRELCQEGEEEDEIDTNPRKYLSKSEHDTLEMRAYRKNIMIMKDLENRNVSSALDWCNTHRSKLTKIGSSFEFKLRQIEFIRILLEKGSKEALRYLNENIREIENDNIEDLRRVLSVYSDVSGTRVWEKNRRDG